MKKTVSSCSGLQALLPTVLRLPELIRWWVSTWNRRAWSTASCLTGLACVGCSLLWVDWRASVTTGTWWPLLCFWLLCCSSWGVGADCGGQRAVAPTTAAHKAPGHKTGLCQCEGTVGSWEATAVNRKKALVREVEQQSWEQKIIILKFKKCYNIIWFSGYKKRLEKRLEELKKLDRNILPPCVKVLCVFYKHSTCPVPIRQEARQIHEWHRLLKMGWKPGTTKPHTDAEGKVDSKKPLLSSRVTRRRHAQWVVDVTWPA